MDVMVSGGSCVLYILNNAPETQMLTNKVQKVVKPPVRRLNNQSRNGLTPVKKTRLGLKSM